MPIIYRLTNKQNNKVYIGRTRFSLESRLNRHWKQRYEDKPLYSDLRVVGLEGFVAEILTEVDDSDWTTEYEIIQQHISLLGRDQVYNVETEGQAHNSHIAIINKYGSLESVCHTDEARVSSRNSQYERYGKLAIHLESSYEPKSYHFLYDNQEFIGFTNLWNYIKSNGYPDIGKTTVKRLAHGLFVKSYPELYNSIRIIEGKGRLD